MKTIHFLPNEPQLLALKDPSGVIDGFNVLYECTDGRILSLPRPAASRAPISMPHPPKPAGAEGPDTPKGTGTYGPLPQVALGSRKTRESIPMDVAFGEIVTFVTKTLNDSGEQWSEQSRQDLCSTVIIAAAKQGLLGVWQR
jgi:hypothetical protein